MIRLYSNEGTFDLSVDLDWVTSRPKGVADRVASLGCIVGAFCRP